MWLLPGGTIGQHQGAGTWAPQDSLLGHTEVPSWRRTPSRSLSLPPGCCAQDTSVPAQARALPRNSCSQKNLCPSSENPGFRAIPASPPLQAKGGSFSPQVRVPLLLFVGLGPPGVHGPGCVWPLAALPPSTSFPLVPLTPGERRALLPSRGQAVSRRGCWGSHESQRFLPTAHAVHKP